jgi:hypothetical protein
MRTNGVKMTKAPMEFWPERADRNYRSTERKLWNATKKGVSATKRWFLNRSEFFEHALTDGYAFLVSPLRIPTAIRKDRRGQSYMFRVPPPELFSPEFCWSSGGVVLGMGFHLGNLVWALANAESGEPKHLIVTGAVYGMTNAASGIYEGVSYLRNRLKGGNLENEVR